MTSSPHTRRLISSSHNMPDCHHSQDICSWCVRRPRRVVLVIHFFCQCKGSNATTTIMSSLVQYQAMVDIRATTEIYTDIADVLLSISGAYTVASLHAIGKATVLKMPRKEGLSLSEFGDVKVDKTHDHDF